MKIVNIFGLMAWVFSGLMSITIVSLVGSSEVGAGAYNSAGAESASEEEAALLAMCAKSRQINRLVLATSICLEKI